MALIKNPGLEVSQGYGEPKDAFLWVYRNDGSPVDTIARGEDNPPAAWGLWYVWDKALWDPSNKVGLARPETRYAPHLERVLEGETGFVMYTYFRVHHGGLVQRLEGLEPGVRYQFTIGNHAWASNKNDPTKSEGAAGPFYALLADIVDKEGAPNYYQARVGVDPAAGLTPYAETVRWGEWATALNAYRDLPAVAAVAQSERMTLFTEHLFRWPFQHCDAYYDKALFVVSQDQPAHDGWVDGRVQYDRTYVLHFPKADKAWPIAVAEATWDQTRWTQGGSADDAGIGPESRRVIAVNPDRWQDDLEDFFETYYAGLHYVPVTAQTPAALVDVLRDLIGGDGGETPPEEPPAEPPEQPPAGGKPRLTNLSSNLAGGLHVKGVFEHWQRMVTEAQPSCLKVFSAGDAYHIGRFARNVEGVSRPKVRTLWRKYVSNDGAWVNVADRRASARQFLELYKAETATAARNMGISEAELLSCIDYIGSINEVVGTWDPETPRLVEFDCYLADMVEEWAGDELRATLLTVAVGNPHESEVELLLPAARKSHERGHLLDYHGYWTARPGRSFLDDHWVYHSGRALDGWDPVFRAHGVYPLYVAGESGVVCSHSVDGTDFGGGESWKALGDFPNYLTQIRRRNERIRAWNAVHGNRCLGDALFTGEFWGWKEFKIEGGDTVLLIEEAKRWA